ncbi:unnamed protein product [Vicia faba]|uniref:H(+)-exporting diphosphatase n=1 Tax=Vicia faba TaxID=3906 RepID=A0AAV1BCD3_VICFA|nr:unnamed protein product [Vicia faba]
MGAPILAPTFYIFFASALPVIAFGEQLSRDTNGSLSTVETLASTAICGIIHSIIGGQPLLILGVAEPTVIMYTYLYNFGKNTPDLGVELFLAWAGWVCFWTAFMLILLAIFNACNIITRFTRIAGELFGMLITVLFFQEAIKGLVGEFSNPKVEEPSSEQIQWQYTNGLLAKAVLSTSLGTRVSLSLDSSEGYVEVWLLRWHNRKNSTFKKPSAYHYDVFLLGIMTLICGLLGLPPSNRVLPQSPMHTKSLAVLRRQLIRKKVVKNAKKYIEAGASERARTLGPKGSDPHKAAVIGDAIGDPLKDTYGPSLNILIKLMAVESLVFAPFFATHGGLLFKFW